MDVLPKLVDSMLSFENHILTLTFNRDDVRNALTGTHIVDDIVQTITWANACKDVAVMIITGTGSVFSSGGNVKDMANRQGDFSGNVSELELRYRQGIQRLPLMMEQAEMPVIAAVNGAAIGAGFDLANMCDLRVASNKAKFGETFINLGLIPGDGGAWFMQRLIGYQKAAELTMTGRIIDAQEAKELGIVLKIVEPDSLLAEANTLALEMANKPAAALRLTKRLMKMAQRTQLPDFLEICAAFQGMAHQEPDHLRAVSQLIDKMNKPSSKPYKK
ncbi:enoyl-CoA hydratase-related protein [uncultured Shewanella sp.]|uniref:enoyl-CoA hydratase-related protein n=1 Tax=uncultured Shewanella sp. TaxID=173975 RepID=UPI002602297D|nr:enoyl-CoA hydratase-related protein [uncultured Shewanella sp.]